MSKAHRPVRKMVFVFCVLLLGVLVWKLDLRRAAEHLKHIGWGAFPILGVSAVWKCVNTAAWALVFPPGLPRPKFSRLFAVYLIGDAANQLLPAAKIGGDVAKPYLLSRDAPMAETVPSVIISKTVEILSGIMFIAAGIGVATIRLPVSRSIQIGLIATGLICGTTAGLACFLQRNRPFTRLYDLFERLRGQVRHKSVFRDKMMCVEGHLASFYATNRGRLLGCFALYVIGWILGTAETWLLMRLVGVEATFSTAFLFLVLITVINTAFFFVPGNVGTFEAGHAYLFVLFKMDPTAGLSIAILKRFRQILCLGAGGALLYIQQVLPTFSIKT